MQKENLRNYFYFVRDSFIFFIVRNMKKYEEENIMWEEEKRDRSRADESTKREKKKKNKKNKSKKYEK